MNRNVVLGWAWLVAFLCANSSLCLADPQADQSQRYALLIGCTKYDNLPTSSQLEGPANDVLLMKDCLEQRYGFRDIHILSEQAGGGNRPTAANIQREFERLEKIAQSGDRVFILMGGHGSRQPVDPKDADPDNFEPDGLDEIFLPADVVLGTRSTPVGNSITDNQIRKWLGKIREKRATVFIVIDACHSGSMVRGNSKERVREVNPETLSPPEVIEQAQATAQLKAKEHNRSSHSGSPFKLPPEAPDLVAIYAAQSIEPTVEMELPEGSRDAKPYGLLTFTLNRLIAESPAPLTYTELVERIQSRYASMGRMFPTPLVDGKDKNNLLFSDKHPADLPRFTLKRDELNRWKVNAGEFQGLTPGSILAVFPVVKTAEDEKPLGHVQVSAEELGAMESVVRPCEYGDLPAPGKLANQMRCRIAFLDFGLSPALLAVDPLVGSDPLSAPKAPQMEAQQVVQLRADLTSVAEKSKLFTITETTNDADWLVRQIDPKSNELFLVPASGVAVSSDAAEPSAAFGPIPRDQAADWLMERLTRIQRASNLVRLADKSAALGSMGEARLDVQLLKLKSKDDKQGEPLSNLVLHPGDHIGLRLRNAGSKPLDVTVLFIDSGFGVEVFFPRSTNSENRLAPTDPPLNLKAHITGGTYGLENLLIIANTAQPNASPADFAFLAQPTIERAGVISRSPGGGNSIDSPLGKLLQNAAYRTGTTRGLAQDTAEGAVIHLKTWRVER